MRRSEAGREQRADRPEEEPEQHEHAHRPDPVDHPALAAEAPGRVEDARRRRPAITKPQNKRLGERDSRVAGQVLALRDPRGASPRAGREFGNSWEWTSLAWTTSRVEALKRGLQVVSVRTSAKTFLITSVSLGDTTKLLVVS